MKTLEEFAVKEIEDLRYTNALLESAAEEYKRNMDKQNRIIDTMRRYIKLNNGYINMYIFNEDDKAFLINELGLKEEANNE